MFDRARLASLLVQVLFIMSLIGLWQWAAVSYPAPYLPRVGHILDAWIDYFKPPLLSQALWPSLYRLLVGFCIGAGLGTFIGLMLGQAKGLIPWTRPTLEFLRFIPAVAILPGALVVLGPTDGMRIFVIAFGAFFPVLLATLDGILRLEPLFLDVARVERLAPWNVSLRVILPATLPAIFTGLRIALGMALIMMIISELMAADNGIGFAMLRAQRLFQSARVYGGVLAIGTVSMLLTLALLEVERRMLAWHVGWRQGTNE
ncbi:ABC transporter permease [Roseovarius sp. S4756]|uniref:ABC transporter permease n=1 Tax=Roseovarius maritimus TaxID=3342637 RepID=UPI003729F4AD